MAPSEQLQLSKTVSIEIREENPGDVTAIRDVNKRAFGQDEEAKIVESLRTNEGVLLSLVATLDDRVVGHVMYSPLFVGKAEGAALGPMAVLPEHQRQGIGSQLIKVGNQKVKDLGYPFIIVVGHADYYPRFGFTPASIQGIKCQWNVPDDVFMLLTLDQERMHDVTGLAQYRPEFSSEQ